MSGIWVTNPNCADQHLLELCNIDSGYESLQILWGVSLYVEEGESVALIGPNGARKTTTLKTIVGQLRPSAGKIFFQGQRIDGEPIYRISRMGISFISETLNLFPAMTVFENLLLGAYKIKGKHQFAESLDFVYKIFPQLKERCSQLAGTLSGGERKILAIARGIMSHPHLLIVDEPSLGLSPLMTTSVFTALANLHKAGLAILLIEQKVNLALRITDRVYVMEHGKSVLDGRTTDLIGNKKLVKAYLGI